MSTFYGIGAKELVKRWITREIVERTKHYPMAGKADTIQQMRREMQEAMNLVADPEKVNQSNKDK